MSLSLEFDGGLRATPPNRDPIIVVDGQSKSLPNETDVGSRTIAITCMLEIQAIDRILPSRKITEPNSNVNHSLVCRYMWLRAFELCSCGLGPRKREPEDVFPHLPLRLGRSMTMRRCHCIVQAIGWNDIRIVEPQIGNHASIT